MGSIAACNESAEQALNAIIEEIKGNVILDGQSATTYYVQVTNADEIDPNTAFDGVNISRGASVSSEKS